MGTEKQGYHVAMIMDGNGRWATERNRPRLFGHAAGIKTVKEIALKAHEANVHTISLYAFAIANWKRDKDEVDGLWKLFHQFFTGEIEELLNEGVRVKVVGNRAGLPADVLERIEDVEERSKDNDGLFLQVALNYDGVEEVARMVKTAIASGIPAEEIDQEYVENNLDTDGDNPPDIMIRTGIKAPTDKLAIFRHSSFLTVQFAQSIGISTTTLWPDFSIEELKEAITYADPDARLFGAQRV